MKRQLLVLFALTAMLCAPLNLAEANGGRGGHGRGGGHGGGHGHGHKVSNGRSFGVGHDFRGVRGHGLGFGIGGFYDDDSDFAELYRELFNNLPYFALHPPVYYSHPVPRTYGYSPFAYPPGVMTPEIVGEPQPVTIINPHFQRGVERPVKTEKKSDRSAAVSAPVEPLVIVNPFVVPDASVVHAAR